MENMMEGNILPDDLSKALDDFFSSVSIESESFPFDILDDPFLSSVSTSVSESLPDYQLNKSDDEGGWNSSCCARNTDAPVSTYSMVDQNNDGQIFFNCQSCDYRASSEGEMKGHIRTHTGDKQCDYCNKSFADKSNLVVHIRANTENKRFKCYYCKKGFADKSDLIVHIRVHTGKKLFKCSICKNRFKRKSHLDLHERVHSGKKPFPCTLCSKSFNQKPRLNAHLKSHK